MRRIRLVREYFWPHARTALRQIGLTERHVNARRVLRWIRARGKTEISLQDVRRDALGQKLDAEQTANLLEALARVGWLRELEAVSIPRGGRPARRWQVNPIIGTPTAETAETAQTPPSPFSREVSAISAVCATQSPCETGAVSRPEHANPADDLWPDLPGSADQNRPALGPVGDSLDDVEPAVRLAGAAHDRP